MQHIRPIYNKLRALYLPRLVSLSIFRDGGCTPKGITPVYSQWDMPNLVHLSCLNEIPFQLPIPLKLTRLEILLITRAEVDRLVSWDMVELSKWLSTLTQLSRLHLSIEDVRTTGIGTIRDPLESKDKEALVVHLPHLHHLSIELRITRVVQEPSDIQYHPSYHPSYYSAFWLLSIFKVPQLRRFILMLENNCDIPFGSGDLNALLKFVPRIVSTVHQCEIIYGYVGHARIDSNSLISRPKNNER